MIEVTEKEIRRMLCRQIREYGSQKEVAKLHSISTQYLNDILRERRNLSNKMLTKLGYKRVIVTIGEEDD